MKSIKHLKLSEQEQLNIRGLLNRNTRELQNGCLEWIAGTNGEYPVLWTGVRQLAVHRAVTALTIPIQDGQIVRHLCHNKLCVKAEHLKVGSLKENGEDESLKHYNLNEQFYKQAAIFVKQGYSVMSACYRVGLPYSSLTRRIINETCR